MLLILWALLAAVVYHAAARLVRLRRLLVKIRFHPGQRAATSIYGAATFLFPWRIPYLTPGANLLFDEKHALLARHGLDVVTSVRPPAVRLASAY